MVKTFQRKRLCIDSWYARPAPSYLPHFSVPCTSIAKFLNQFGRKQMSLESILLPNGWKSAFKRLIRKTKNYNLSLSNVFFKETIILSTAFSYWNRYIRIPNIPGWCAFKFISFSRKLQVGYRASKNAKDAQALRLQALSREGLVDSAGRAPDVSSENDYSKKRFSRVQLIQNPTDS